MKPLKESELYQLKELKRSEFYPTLLKAFDLALAVMQRNMVSLKIEKKEQVFDLVQLKSQIDGANKFLSLVKSQIETKHK